MIFLWEDYLTIFFHLLDPSRVWHVGPHHRRRRQEEEEGSINVSSSIVFNTLKGILEGLTKRVTMDQVENLSQFLHRQVVGVLGVWI